MWEANSKIDILIMLCHYYLVFQVSVLLLKKVMVFEEQGGIPRRLHYIFLPEPAGALPLH